ncbi:MAG: DUF2207 domain-containing protein [Propionibacteriaceae bacterium]|jgi:uncharacterized membrane protein YgcG|nr:DUF2207 domain-containing protein [Propionibacteriaceae bacterium]
MRRFVWLLTAVFTLSLGLLAAPAAQAAAGDRISRLSFTVEVRPDGSLDVVETLEVAFAGRGHGPYVSFVTSMAFEASDPRSDDWLRKLDYDFGKVTSPTGAPTNTQIERDTSGLRLRIGDEDRYVSGTQTYVIPYTVTGALNGAEETGSGDELWWNIVGTGWEIPIDEVAVSIVSPTEVTQVSCWSAPAVACEQASKTGAAAAFGQSGLLPGNGLTIAVGWPAGSYPGIKPIVVAKHPFAFAFAPAVLPLALSGLLAVGAIVVVHLVRRRGRDERFGGLPPGSFPAPGEAPPILREEVRDAPVQFHPPAGLPPAHVGALVRERAVMADVTATLVDLAVRGHYRFVQSEKSNSFTLERDSAAPPPTTPFELKLYRSIFRNGENRVSRRQLERRNFGTAMLETQRGIARDLVRQRWYRRDPAVIVASWLVIGFVLAAAGVVGGLGLGFWLGSGGQRGWVYLGLPVVLLGLGFMFLARAMPIRTPVGSALASQGYGFKKYLETAEAGQLRWEEGQDIFSRYLPYAIAFGCAERWAKVFEELAQQGVSLPQPTWYYGPSLYFYSPYAWSSITQSVGHLGDVAVSGLPQATAGSSGGSAFSGGFSGGGFGGGVGGGGGGTW